MFDINKYTTEQKIIKDFVSQLAKDYDALYFLENMKKEKFLSEFWKVIGDGGYIGMLAPEKYGGVDFKVEDLAIFFENMAKNGMISFTLMNQIICCDFITKFGNEEQKKKYLPEIISGKICGYAYLEYAEGASLFDIYATAEKDGDVYRLNGQKKYVVSAGDSANFIIAARTKPINNDNKREGISLFIVDAKSKGIETIQKEVNVRVTEEKETTMITGDTFLETRFNDVEIPKENLIGRENSGGEYVDETSSLMMIMLAVMAIGWGGKVLDMAVEYSKERIIFEEPIGSYQAVQHPMVRAKTDIELAKLAIERAVRVYDSDQLEDMATYASIAKYAATEAAYNACDISIQIHGGSGFDRDSGIITLWPLILLSRIIPLNNDIILERFSEEVFDLPASAER